MARPKSADPMVPIHTRVSGNIAEALAAVSTFRQMSESELIRQYIEDGLRQHLKNAENELEREHAAQRDRLRQLKAEIAV